MKNPILDLQERVAALEQSAVRFRLGVVTTQTPLAVSVGGSSTSYTNIKQIDGATLDVGETVAVLLFGNDLLVLGRIV